jgi:50S ribosomal protein L16 3-hydroxylase
MLLNFDVSDFLHNYWQKKPMVIRQAFEDVQWLEPNELAGLACEEEIESRIISQVNNKWQVECGPFEEEQLSKMPEQDWTLLVQGVDQWVPQVQDVLRSFSFLPSWRLDDIMVSFAPVGGTVSQHYDFFDVFLIQGEGSRTWQVGQICDSDSELLPNTSVRILKEFEPKLEVTLAPGDMLYIPAKHAHLGVSVENSMTYSVGFRAPSIRDIVDGVATSALETLKEDERYRDSLESLNAQRGEIPGAAIQKLKIMLEKALTNDSLVSRWLGEYVTERKYPELELFGEDSENWQARVEAGEYLERNPASRFAYAKLNGCELFVDGEGFACSLALAQALADQEDVCSTTLLELACTELDECVIAALIERGALLFGEE